jgi:predicted CoA-binding protein
MSQTQRPKTLVLGASENPGRTSYTAVKQLLHSGYEVLAVGSKPGVVHGIDISTELPKNEIIDTITLYIRPEIQNEMTTQIIELKPKRIIFNPGTENPMLENLATNQGIVCERACTLVLLSLGQY